MTRPVTVRRIRIAENFGLKNVDDIATACRRVGIPFYVACALFEKESGGKNVYGHDEGGFMTGYPFPVTEGNFEVFQWHVFKQGHKSNGVGPSQITWKGYFPDMEAKGLKPWVPLDNMVYGLTTLRDHYVRWGSWEKAGRLYNGKLSYGQDLVVKIDQWQARLKEVRTPGK